MDFRAYRKSKGWTLEDVAGFLDLADPATVSRHERGVRFPEPDILERYMKLTNGDVTASDFIAARKRRNRAPKLAKVVPA